MKDKLKETLVEAYMSGYDRGMKDTIENTKDLIKKIYDAHVANNPSIDSNSKILFKGLIQTLAECAQETKDIVKRKEAKEDPYVYPTHVYKNIN